MNKNWLVDVLGVIALIIFSVLAFCLGRALRTLTEAFQIQTEAFRNMIESFRGVVPWCPWCGKPVTEPAPEGCVNRDVNGAPCHTRNPLREP